MEDPNRQLEKFLRRKPTLGKQVYIAPGAIVVGDVTLGNHSSVWHNAVLRADINRIVIGHHTNVQDTAVLHLADESPCILGNFTTVGHGAVVHACKVGNEVLVGMRAILLDGVEVGAQSIIGAGALVTQSFRVPPGSLVLGAPARIVRTLTFEERASIKGFAEKYVQLASSYLKLSPCPAPCSTSSPAALRSYPRPFSRA
jgi:gamma-carbonic anhydrase